MLVARRRLLRQALALADAATLTASFVVAYVVVGTGFDRKFPSFATYAWLLLPIVAIWLACLAAFGFYCSATYYSKRSLPSRLMRMQLLSGLLLLSFMYLTRSQFISRLLLQTFLALSFLLLVAQKFALTVYLGNTRQRADLKRRKVVLVSNPAAAERYLQLMQERASVSADIIAVLTPSGWNYESPVLTEAHRPVGVVDELPAILQAQVVDEVIALSPLPTPVLEQLSLWCSLRGILLRIWLELPHVAIGIWTTEYFGGGAFLLSLATVPQNLVSLAIKRIVDIVGAMAGIILCSVVYAFYGLRLRRETGGSALFRQQRVGRNGRRFTLYKFRTMGLGADAQKAALTLQNEMSGPMFKMKDDPRVTPTGRRLRQRHLDELPQFWNVLRSDMSLVGTRPPTEDETSVYKDHHRRRLSMKPGLTGLWQLSGNGRVKNFEDVVKLDCQYIDNWSLWLDFKILAKTVTKVVRGDAW